MDCGTFTDSEMMELDQMLQPQDKHVEELTNENRALCLQVRQLREMLKNAEEKGGNAAIDIDSEEVQRSVEENEKLKRECAHLQRLYRDIEKQCAEAQRAEAALRFETQKVMLEQGKRIAALEKGKLEREEEAKKFSQKSADLEEQVDAAKGHLARKIREVAMVQGRLEEVQGEVTELHRQQELDREKMCAQSGEIQNFQQKEEIWKAQMEEAQELIRLREEELQAYVERLDFAENAVKELREVEERQRELEKLFAGFESILRKEPLRREAGSLRADSEVIEGNLMISAENERRDEKKVSKAPDLFDSLAVAGRQSSENLFEL